MSQNNKIFIVVVSIICSLLLFKCIRENQDKKLLDNSPTEENFAILTFFNGNGVHSQTRGDFEYYVNNRKYKLRDYHDYGFMQVGDTVRIEYSLKDNSVARVIDRYYMSKYKNLKK